MKKIIFLILLIVTVTGCTGRLPSTNTAQSIIKKHLNKYAKKYPNTVLSGHHVAKVDILTLEEMQKHFATAQAVVGLENETQLKIQMNFLYKRPLGWRQQGWEILDAAPVPSP